ncbi:MAG: O-antigen ligase family protein [Gemmatimonadales bacterium]
MSTLAYAALWLFVFSLPWENAFVALFPGMSIVTKITGGLALAAALAFVVVSGQVRRWRGMHVAALLFVIWGGGELFFHQLGQRVPYKYSTYVQLFVVLWIVWELAPSWPRQLGLMAAYVFGSYVAAISTIMQYRQQAGALRRYAALQTDPNSLAMTLALALPMAWYLAATSRSALLRWACRAYMIVGLVAVALTASRGGMVATIMALAIVPLTMTKLSPGRLVTALVVLALSGAVAVAYVPEKIVERLATTSTEVEDLSLGGRFGLWKAGVKAFTARPITGYGPGSWRTAVAPWLGPNPQVAHNSFLSVLVELGLVGLTLYLTMFVAVFRATRKLPSLERRFTLVLFLTLIVAMLPLSWEDQKAVWFILALLLGLACAAGVTLRGAVRQAPAVRSAPVVRPVMAARSREPFLRSPRDIDRDPTT